MSELKAYDRLLQELRLLRNAKAASGIKESGSVLYMLDWYSQLTQLLNMSGASILSTPGDVRPCAVNKKSPRRRNVRVVETGSN